MVDGMLNRITSGRTDLVFDYVAAGHAATAADENGVSLLKWCAYYGDVSAARFLLAHGESLQSLSATALSDAAFHGHWQLCEFLIENGADVNQTLPDTGETPLHAALCTSDRTVYDLVLRVLLAGGADPNRVTKPGAETGAFMRDSRTRAETPLHRAAAFGTEETIQLLLQAGAMVDARDMHGDSPLSWASWYGRPTSILKLLCFGPHRIHPERKSMRAYRLGTPVS